VILRSLGWARYQVHRGSDVEALVWGTYEGWDIYLGDVPLWPPSRKPVRSFRLLREARDWLNSPEGQQIVDNALTRTDTHP
jgi:hypothetical protein